MKRTSKSRFGTAVGIGFGAAMGAGVLAVGLGAGQPGEGGMSPDMMQKIRMLQQLTPGKGYLKAHMGENNPFKLLGGPIEISVDQHQGGVFVALPDKRRLDPYVFGTPKMPRSFGGTPGITGVPPLLRETEGDRYTTMSRMSPFGDKFIVLPGADLTIRAKDVTATDAAYSEDSVQMTASWEDRQGNTYTVKCNKVLPHGLEYPTFGGVTTNHMLHGWTRIGTPLMPTEFTYFAFWGMGTVSKNGEQIDGPRLVHGMLTEYVRGEGYKLAFDDEVTPSRRHFHLMVAPFRPDMEAGHFEQHPVKTGFTLPNGMELPFWHVMFENLDISASR